jgi:MFS family permease
MQLDDLKSTWEHEMTIKEGIVDFEDIRRRVNNLDRRAKATWAIELFACAGVIIGIIAVWLTAWMTTETLNPLFHLGVLAMVAAVIFVGWKIISGRKASTSDDWTLSAKVNIQIERREKDAKLLNSIAYWYLSPMFVAVVLSSYGGYVQRTGSYFPDAATWVYWIICLALYVGINFLNRYSVKNKVQPILDQLYALRKELERP